VLVRSQNMASLLMLFATQFVGKKVVLSKPSTRGGVDEPRTVMYAVLVSASEPLALVAVNET